MISDVLPSLYVPVTVIPVKSVKAVPTATSPPVYVALILVSVTCSSPAISTVTEQVADTLPQVAVIVA